MSDVLIAASRLGSLMMSVAFLCYVVVIVIPFLRHRPDAPGNPDEFAWHLFIPCLDEEAVIGPTVATLRRLLPTAHLWIIDDHSADATAAIAAAAAEQDPLVHLVSRCLPEARQGKGEALNAAYRALGAWLPPDADRVHVIVGVFDADGTPAPDCLAVCAGPTLFGDPTVAAVQIGVHMVNRGEARPRPGHGRTANFSARVLIRVQDLEFRTAITAQQLLRRRTRTVGLGGNGQFTRLSALQTLDSGDQRVWRGLLLEDYELSVQLLIGGHRIEFTPDTHVEQEALTRLRPLLAQRTRWGQGGMQCGRYLPRVWTSPHVSTVGAFEVGYFLITPWLQLLGSLVYPIPMILLIAAALNAAGDAAVTAWLLVAAYTVIGLTPFLLWGPLYRRRCETRRGRLASFGDGLAFAMFVFVYYLTAWRALSRIALRRRAWVKTRRLAADVPTRLLSRSASADPS